jgi:hypothetical protein
VEIPCSSPFLLDSSEYGLPKKLIDFFDYNDFPPKADQLQAENPPETEKMMTAIKALFIVSFYRRNLFSSSL